VEGFGLYRYDGKTFTNFTTEDGLGGSAIQSTNEDRDGRIWTDGYMGLYRFNGTSFINMTAMLPWQY